VSRRRYCAGKALRPRTSVEASATACLLLRNPYAEALIMVGFQSLETETRFFPDLGKRNIPASADAGGPLSLRAVMVSRKFASLA
jgi:hypothetical protein